MCLIAFAARPQMGCLASCPNFAANLEMYIKDQVFKDEDTLLEMLFDFSLGEASSLVGSLKDTIGRELQQNEAYTAYYNSLTDEEDRLELETEEQMIRLAEALMARFDTFQVKKQKLFGIKGTEQELLYEVDLV